MRDKADDSLAPPPAALTIPVPVVPGMTIGGTGGAGSGATDASKFIVRKKPHTLPPLEKFRSLEGRGSPVPQARRRSSVEEQLLQEDGQVVPADGRPLIRLTKCADDTGGSGSATLGSALGGGGSGAGGLGRLPPPKQSAPAAPPQLSPIANRYTPLQPIRRSSENAGGFNNNTP